MILYKLHILLAPVLYNPTNILGAVTFCLTITCSSDIIQA
nr:MAG TPA: hypothetical protein [Caudoviricetes sp.]